MAERRKILFLCTGNSCRSQMAEALLRTVASKRFEALSAGSHPAGFVHGLAIEAMARMDISLDDHESKSWDVYADTPLDLVITVCDSAANETCPTWPGAPLTAHWPLPDPAFHTGTEEDRIEFALRVAERLRTKIEGLVDLDWSAPRQETEQQLHFLGEI